MADTQIIIVMTHNPVLAQGAADDHSRSDFEPPEKAAKDRRFCVRPQDAGPSGGHLDLELPCPTL